MIDKQSYDSFSSLTTQSLLMAKRKYNEKFESTENKIWWGIFYYAWFLLFLIIKIMINYAFAIIKATLKGAVRKIDFLINQSREKKYI